MSWTKLSAKSFSMQFSLRVHANSIQFFLINSLDLALKNCICNFSLRCNMIKLEQKQKGGRNIRNILYIRRVKTLAV